MSSGRGGPKQQSRQLSSAATSPPPADEGDWLTCTRAPELQGGDGAGQWQGGVEGLLGSRGHSHPHSSCLGTPANPSARKCGQVAVPRKRQGPSPCPRRVWRSLLRCIVEVGVQRPHNQDPTRPAFACWCQALLRGASSMHVHGHCITNQPLDDDLPAPAPAQLHPLLPPSPRGRGGCAAGRRPRTDLGGMKIWIVNLCRSPHSALVKNLPQNAAPARTCPAMLLGRAAFTCCT